MFVSYDGSSEKEQIKNFLLPQPFLGERTFFHSLKNSHDNHFYHFLFRKVGKNKVLFSIPQNGREN